MPLFPRTRSSKAAAPPQRAVIASAVLVKQSQLRAVPEQRDWQTQAWDFYDRCGELRFAAQWFSNALARCRLYVGVPDENGAGDPDPLDEERPELGDLNARVPLEELFDGSHADMLARLAIHLTIPGESYLVGLDTPPKDDEGEPQRRWIVASGEEFKKQNRKVKVRLPDTNEEVEVDLENSTVIRIWRPHARKAWEADSPVRALLPVLKELMDLTAHITASVESRLAGAGILWMPEEATLPSPTNQGNKPLHEDPGMATLIDAMVTPITDRDSASSVVPILGRLPAATQGKTPAKPQYMTFATPLDEKVQTLREAAIRRIATGLDMPGEVLLGMGETSNHWTAWQLEESAIKLHIEPLLGLICQALTERYLRPALEALGIADPEKYVIWFDASELALRPNRSPESQALYNLGELKGDVVRREAGFTDDDAMDEDEWERWLLVQLAKTNVDPLNVAPYLAKLGIELDLTAMLEAKAAAQPPTTAPTAPGAEEEPPPGEQGGEVPSQRQRPDIPGTPGAPGTTPPGGGGGTSPAPTPPAAVASAVAAAPAALVSSALLTQYPLKAVEMGVMQALEKAGKKLLSWGGRRYRNRLECPAWEIHTRLPAADFDVDQLLEGAYGCLDEVLGDQPCVKATVDGYVRDLLTHQRRHTRAALYDALVGAGCLYSGDDAGGAGRRAA